MAKKKKQRSKKKLKAKKVKKARKRVVKKAKSRVKKKVVKKKKVKKVVKSPKKSAGKKSKVAAPSAPPATWTTPAWGETEIGIVEHFFGEINVAAIKLRKPLKVGDKIHIKGHTTDLSQMVDSMQIEHQSVTDAPSGSDIGIKVTDRVREHDVVYKVD